MNGAAWWMLVTSTCMTLSCKSGTSAPMHEAAAEGERMPATSVRTDIPGLERLIDLPKQVASVRWEYTRAHGNGSLVAVLRLGPSEIETLLRDSPRLDVQSPVTIDPRLVGDDAVTPTPSSNQWSGVNIEPRAFVNPTKGGLLNGTATVIAGSGLVYLALYEM